jgi:hypothetical protein
MMQSDEPHDAAGGTTTTIARTLLAKGAAVTLVTLILAVAVTTTVATAQNYTDLYDFNNNGGPNDPHWNAIAQGRDGNMYSTTDQAFTGGRGDVFKITPTGTLTVLHNFKWTDGRTPIGGLTLGTDGKFYGATYGGGLSGTGRSSGN